MRAHVSTSKERVLPPGLQVTKNHPEVSFNFETVLSDLRKRYNIIFGQSDGDFTPPIVESMAKILSDEETKLSVDASVFRTTLRFAMLLLSPHYTKKTKGRSVLVLQGYPESKIKRVLDAITVKERPVLNTPPLVKMKKPQRSNKQKVVECPDIPDDRMPTAQEGQLLIDYLYQKAANDPVIANFLRHI